MTKPLIIANWKSNKSLDQAVKWLDEYEASPAATQQGIEVAIAPAFPELLFVSNRLLDKQKHPGTKLAVQDLSPFPKGSYTGAVSSENLAGMRVSYALLGHSERRRYFHETASDIANKVDQALAADIRPVICVDQPYQREQAAALSPDVMARCIVAYEPLEAIGSGLPQAAEEAAAVIAEIKANWGDIPVIYGGSVNKDNVLGYLQVCQGVLVATHSLDARDFAQVVQQAQLAI